MSKSGRLTCYRSIRLRYFRVALPLQLLVIGLIIVFSLSAGTGSKTSYENAELVTEKSADTLYNSHPEIVRIDSLCRFTKVDEAIILYESIIDQSLPIPPGGHIYAVNQIASVLNRNRRFEEALTWLDSGRSLEQLIPFRSTISAHNYYLKGVAYNFLDEVDSAEKYHHKALRIRKEIKTPEKNDLAWSYMGLGNVKRYMTHDYDSATTYYELASQELKNKPDFYSHETSFRCHYNLAATFRVRQNFDKALLYARESYRNAQEINSDIYVLYALNTLINIHTDLKDYEKAELYSKELIELSEPSDRPDYGMLVNGYINMGINQISKSEYNLAIENLNKGLVLAKSKLSTNPSYQKFIYEELGLAYQDLGDNKKAIENYRKSIVLAETSNENHQLNYVPAKLMAKIYAHMGRLDSALYYYQYSLNKISPVFPLDSLSILPPIDSIPKLKASYELIVVKADAFSTTTENQNLINNLKIALDHYLTADSIIAIKRADDLLASEELWMANDIQSDYWNALDCLYRLDSLEGRPAHADIALKFMNQNKANIMFRSLRKSLFLEDSGVHDSLVQYHRDISAALAHWESVKRQGIDEEKKTEVEKKIFHLISEKSSVDDLIDKTYTNFKNAVQQERINIDRLKRFAAKDSSLIVEYYQTNDEIYCLSISANKVQLNRIPLSSTFQQHFNSYQKELSNKNPFEKENFKHFTRSSFYLFQHLIPKNIALDNFKVITIIPDGQLSKIPFDALLTSKHEGDNIDYGGLDYLIKKIKINYYHNFNALLSTDEKNTNTKLTLGGWAYEEIPGKKRLFSTLKEVNRVSEDYRKRLFTGPLATKGSFINKASDYDILHLAIHGSDGSDSVSSPTLQFYPSRDDGVLFDYEIYQVPLSARMVVLSACKTGSGDIQSGEGMFSMARSFFYAGCPSIVLSLWNLKDGSSSEIIAAYYQYLKTGMKKDESLRSAKLSYLNNTDNYLSHPANWAGTMLVGDNSALWGTQDRSMTKPLIIILSMALISVFGFFYLRKLRLKGNHK